MWNGKPEKEKEKYVVRTKKAEVKYTYTTYYMYHDKKK